MLLNDKNTNIYEAVICGVSILLTVASINRKKRQGNMMLLNDKNTNIYEAVICGVSILYNS